MSTFEGEGFSALIIKIVPYAEKDLILSLLTEHHGRVSCIMRSARSGKKSIPEVLEVGRCHLRSGRGSLQTLTHFKPFHLFKGLRTSISRFTAACVWAECLDCLTVEDAPDDQALYEIGVSGLTCIDEANDSRLALRALCGALDDLLEHSGFGGLREQTAGSRKLRIQIARVEGSSGRTLRSIDALQEMLRELQDSEPSQ